MNDVCEDLSNAAYAATRHPERRERLRVAVCAATTEIRALREAVAARDAEIARLKAALADRKPVAPPDVEVPTTLRLYAPLTLVWPDGVVVTVAP